MHLAINTFKITRGLEWKKNYVKKVCTLHMKNGFLKKIHDGELAEYSSDDVIHAL